MNRFFIEADEVTKFGILTFFLLLNLDKLVFEVKHRELFIILFNWGLLFLN